MGPLSISKKKPNPLDYAKSIVSDNWSFILFHICLTPVLTLYVYAADQLDYFAQYIASGCVVDDFPGHWKYPVGLISM